ERSTLADGILDSGVAAGPLEQAGAAHDPVRALDDNVDGRRFVVDGERAAAGEFDRDRAFDELDPVLDAAPDHVLELEGPTRRGDAAAGNFRPVAAEEDKGEGALRVERHLFGSRAGDGQGEQTQRRKCEDTPTQ